MARWFPITRTVTETVVVGGGDRDIIWEDTFVAADALTFVLDVYDSADYGDQLGDLDLALGESFDTADAFAAATLDATTTDSLVAAESRLTLDLDADFVAPSTYTTALATIRPVLPDTAAASDVIADLSATLDAEVVQVADRFPSDTTTLSVTVEPTVDTWLDEANPTTAHGSDTTLEVLGRDSTPLATPDARVALIGWDLTGWDLSDYAVTVGNDVTLSLHVVSDIPLGTEGLNVWLVHSATQPWDEASVWDDFTEGTDRTEFGDDAIQTAFSFDTSSTAARLDDTTAPTISGSSLASALSAGTFLTAHCTESPELALTRSLIEVSDRLVEPARLTFTFRLA